MPAGGGEAIPEAVQGQLNVSLKADLKVIRLHTNPQAQELARSLSARAVTYGRDIFLGPGEQPTDVELIGHEVAHVIQQQGVPQVQRWSNAPEDACEREARSASTAVVRGVPFTVRERTTSPRVQRLGLSDVLDYFADKANNIPGFRMFTIVLGVNPINWSRVERSAANILRALIEFLPGGKLITDALNEYGIFDKIGNWVEQQLKTLGDIGASIKKAIGDFLDSLGWRDIFRLGSVWNRAKRIFTDPITRIIDFGKGLVIGILKFIKEAILKPLAKLAEKTRGYDLLKAVIGEDPVTGEKVPRTPDTLIGGFMKLIGQEEVWNNIKKANAIGRAWTWFQGVLSGLLGFVRQIPALFIAALKSLELFDVVLPPRAFVKLARVFGNFIVKFLSWGLQQVFGLLQIIFEVVAPGAVPYIRKAAGAFKKIIENPVGFIRNLVRAGIQGFKQFGINFLAHLRKSLIEWLTGTMSGANIHIPQAFTPVEIIKFVLSVLGLTWQNIRGKLVKAIGEPAVKVLETTFDIVVTLVKEGPAAAWDKILQAINNLKEMVIDAAMNFVKQRVVEAAIQKLLTSLNPAGAFIQAIIAIYNTIMFFVERLKQIIRVAMAFIDSISAIANGVIAAAANKVEQTMAGLLTLVISFLARIAGLGKVSDAVKDIINKVRAPIDKGLDKVIEWIVAQGKKLGKLVATAGVPQDPNERLRLAARAAVTAAKRLTGTVSKQLLTPIFAGIKARYGLADIQAFERGGNWWVIAKINPTLEQNLEVPLVNPVDAAKKGMLDLYRGIHYRDQNFDFSKLSGAALEEQLVKEEDFAEAVYSLLGVDRATSPTTTPAQRRGAARRVRNEVEKAKAINDVRPWWTGNRKAQLFFQLLQRFINARTELQDELKNKRAKQLAGFKFTDIPFISTTKRADRAAEYALGTVKATPGAGMPATTGRIAGKVFVYLFDGQDLVELQAADIRFLASQGKVLPHARYSKADREVTFTGSIPPKNRVGEVQVRDTDNVGGVAGTAKGIAESKAGRRGGLLTWEN